MPDRSFADYIADFENMLHLAHCKTCFLELLGVLEDGFPGVVQHMLMTS